MGFRDEESRVIELRKKIIVELFNDPNGMWLENTEELLDQQYIRNNIYRSMSHYRDSGYIDIKGYGINDKTGQIVRFYDPKDFPDMEKKLGITLNDTTGLIPQKEVIYKYGITHANIKNHRKNGRR